MRIPRLLSGGVRQRLLEPNDRGHYPIDRMGVELGVWFGSYHASDTALVALVG
jgi:hypothetical protein